MIKRFLILVFTIFAIASCKENPAQSEKQTTQAIAYRSVGNEIVSKGALNATQMTARFQKLEPGDSLQVKFTAPVNSVCKKKGCWMVLDLEDEKEVMVKFRDYSFFVPKNIENKKVVVSGKAYLSEVSVEEQRHYAKDGGKTSEEIAAITQPKRTLSFLADGVLIEK